MNKVLGLMLALGACDANHPNPPQGNESLLKDAEQMFRSLPDSSGTEQERREALLAITSKLAAWAESVYAEDGFQAGTVDWGQKGLTTKFLTENTPLGQQGDFTLFTRTEDGSGRNGWKITLTGRARQAPEDGLDINLDASWVRVNEVLASGSDVTNPEN